jgi:YidC/Oxa1 family membrane protein insertase
VGQIGYLFNLIFTFPIFNVLMLLYRLIGDFGVSIIVLTLAVKLLLFPLTLQQLKSMKATQALQPQMQEIKKKYAKDQQAQAQAMQALYKEYGMNPLAGNCLPLLIQMPVLFGLFYALSAVLRTAHNVSDVNNLLYPFIPKFQHFPNIDLNWFTFINPAWHFSLGAPDPTHMLPILAALATFLQLRMSQQRTGTTATSDAMAQQMKLMQLISPAMVLFFGWNYAAGLALYWTISSVFAMFQQYFVTGWGSLLVKPDFLPGGNTKANDGKDNDKSYTGDRAKETKLLARASEPKAEKVVESGPIGSKLQTNSYGNGNGSSSARRRNASARRRSSNNIPKRNASRS